MAADTEPIAIPVAAPEETAPAGGRDTFRALRYRDYRFLWCGQISNSAALWIEQVALPLLVLYLVPNPAEAAIHLGLVLGARTLPQLGFGLLGGVFADWYDRRRLLLISMSLSTTINVTFASLIVMGSVTLAHVYVVIVLRAIASSFDQPSRSSLIPTLVPVDDLANAVALNSASMQTMRIAGGPLAGLLVAFAGFPGAFVTIAMCSAAAVVFVSQLRTPRMERRGERDLRAAGRSLRQGAVYCWREPAVRACMLLMMALFMLGMAYLQVFAPLFAKHVLHIGDTGYALMTSVAGMGALAGLLAIATFPIRRHRGWVMLGLLMVLGVGLTGFGASTYLDALPLTFGFIALVGLVQSSFFALATTVIMQTTRPEMLGRVMGLLSLDRATITAGATVAGVLSALIGPQLAQILFGAACLVLASTFIVTMPGVRRLH